MGAYSVDQIPSFLFVFVYLLADYFYQRLYLHFKDRLADAILALVRRYFDAISLRRYSAASPKLFRRYFDVISRRFRRYSDFLDVISSSFRYYFLFFDVISALFCHYDDDKTFH